jgi:hypothetical protein
VSHGQVGLSDQIIRKTGADLRERLARVAALVESTFARAADDRPGLALEARHPRVDDGRMARLQFDIHRAHAVVDEQDLPPGCAAIAGLEDAAIRAAFEGVAVCRDPDDVRICRVNANRRDLAGVVEPREPPGGAAVNRFVDPAARGDVAAQTVRPGADVNDVRIGIRDRDRPDRAERNLAVSNRSPARAPIDCAEQPAAGGTHVEGAWLGRHTCNGRHPSTAGRPDETIRQPFEERRIYWPRRQGCG